MIQRVPIKVKRTPIKLPDNIKMQVKIWELSELTREDDIYELSQHYNMLVMQATNKAGYNSLSQSNYTEHKNWIHFESVYEICRIKGWDSKLYIESQFERAKLWTKMKYPLPNMMYSNNAIRHFTNYLSTIRQKYERDVGGSKKEKGRETKTLKTQIIDDIVQSVDYLVEIMGRTGKRDDSQHKALTIFNHWDTMSPYYLWSIPWFHDVLKDVDGKKAEECRKEFDRIKASKSVRTIINETVSQVERQFSLPPNMTF